MVHFAMLRVRSTALAIACSIGLASGCAGSAHKRAYIAGAVANEVTTQAHTVYSGLLNERVTKCDPEFNDDVQTEADFDECLGPYAHNDKVVAALTAYKAAAEALFVVLSNEQSTPEEKTRARKIALGAALDALSLIPQAEKYVDQLRSLTR